MSEAQAEGYKNKEKKGKKVEEEEEEPEVILNFQAVENAHNFIPRERRSDDRRDFKRAEGRHQGRPQGNRRGPRDEKRSGPKVNVMNEKAFPKL